MNDRHPNEDAKAMDKLMDHMIRRPAREALYQRRKTALYELLRDLKYLREDWDPQSLAGRSALASATAAMRFSADMLTRELLKMGAGDWCPECGMLLDPPEDGRHWCEVCVGHRRPSRMGVDTDIDYEREAERRAVEEA